MKLLRNTILRTGVICTLVSASAMADIVSDKVQPIDQLMVYQANEAVLESSTDSSRYLLRFKPASIKLQGIWPQAFTSRIEANDLLKIWDAVFESPDKVFALMTWSGEHKGVSLRLKLSKPDYDKDTGELRFLAQPSDKAKKVLGFLDANKPKPRALPDTTLFGVHLYLDDPRGRVVWYTTAIDSSNSTNASGRFGEVINGCVIQPDTQCPEANLSGANLVGVNLRGSNLVRANLTRTNLEKADLSRVDFTESVLNQTQLSSATMTRVGLYNATVGETYFDQTDLEEANLSYGDWTNVALKNTNLLNANMNNMVQNGVSYCGVKMPDGTINNSGCAAPTPTPTPTPKQVTVTLNKPKNPKGIVGAYAADYPDPSSLLGYCNDNQSLCSYTVQAGKPLTFWAETQLTAYVITWSSGCTYTGLFNAKYLHRPRAVVS